MTNKQIETLYKITFTKKKVLYDDLVDAFAAVGKEMIDNKIIYDISEMTFSKVANYIDEMYANQRFTLVEQENK